MSTHVCFDRFYLPEPACCCCRPHHQAQGFDGLMEGAARSIKANINDIKANIRDLTASIHTAAERRLGGGLAAAAGGGGGGGRSYLRMASHESNQGGQEMLPLEEAGSLEYSKQQSTAAAAQSSRGVAEEL